MPMHQPHDNLALALEALGMGYAPVPVVGGTKVPAVKWKEWQDRLPPEGLVREWFRVRRNLAIVTSGMVVFDCDDPDLAALVLRHCGDTTHKVRTPRGGMHLGFRRRAGVALGNRVKIRGLDLDLRTFGGIELIPCSETEDGRYEWLSSGLRPLAELPCGNIGWTRTRARKVLRKPHAPLAGESLSRIRDPFAYCRTIESVQGQNGSRQLVRVVCTLRDAGVPREAAFRFLVDDWNPRCADPPWSERELLHAMRHYG